MVAGGRLTRTSVLSVCQPSEIQPTTQSVVRSIPQVSITTLVGSVRTATRRQRLRKPIVSGSEAEQTDIIQPISTPLAS